MASTTFAEPLKHNLFTICPQRCPRYTPDRRPIQFARLAGERITRFTPASASPPSVATRPRVAARSAMSGASWRETRADRCGREMLSRCREQCGPPTPARNDSRFPPYDPVREAGGRTDSAYYTPTCSSPSSMATCPRVMAVGPPGGT
jgi:hypothetical protein